MASAGNEHHGPGLFFAVGLTVLAGLGGFYFAFFREQPSPEAPAAEPFARSAPAAAAPPPADDNAAVVSSGLDLVQKGSLSYPSGAQGASQGAGQGAAASHPGAARPPASQPAGAAQSRKIWALKPRFEALNAKFMSRNPVVARYEREWMKNAELHKLRDEFMEGDHDPIKFVHALAGSKAFSGLIVRYASQSGIQAFAREALANVPADVMGEVTDHLNKDGVAANLAQKLIGALGLPPMIGGRMDPNALMQQVLKNPQSIPGLPDPGQNRR